MPPAIHFEAKFYALRKSKDGLIVSFVIHPNDAPNELITAPIGEQYIVALAPYVEKPDVVLRTYPNEGVREINEGFLSESRSAEPTQGGSACKQITAAEYAIKMAHTHAGGSEEVLQGIRDYCGVKSCSEFKTNPGAVKRFHDWEYINGYVQGRP